MVHELRDALTGAAREAVLVSQEDARRLGLVDGEPVVLRNALGEYRGRALIAPVQPGNLEIHWPEGEVLIDSRHRSPLSGIPDYNAVVSLERATTPAAAPAPV
jgi:anaerobic selenocysteine-containing dehydrogenase